MCLIPRSEFEQKQMESEESMGDIEALDVSHSQEVRFGSFCLLCKAAAGQ